MDKRIPLMERREDDRRRMKIGCTGANYYKL
jgi:hypothetical protein